VDASEDRLDIEQPLAKVGGAVELENVLGPVGLRDDKLLLATNALVAHRAAFDGDLSDDGVRCA
jgi:hypothetical protein